jgi:hypothetical protein
MWNQQQNAGGDQSELSSQGGHNFYQQSQKSGRSKLSNKSRTAG